MAKKLLEMSLEELWELFPIFLIEHNDKWNKNYEKIELLKGFFHNDTLFSLPLL